MDLRKTIGIVSMIGGSLIWNNSGDDERYIAREHLSRIEVLSKKAIEDYRDFSSESRGYLGPLLIGFGGAVFYSGRKKEES